jgi:hypothetical protein
MNELKTRGVEDVLIVIVDGLKGFPEECREFRVGAIPMETEEAPHGMKETTGYCRSVAGSAFGWSGREDRV